MRHMVLAAALAALPGLANAQVVEVGATMAAGCLGSEGSLCGTGTHPMPGAHASVWLGDRVELAARVSRVALPPYQSTVGYPSNVRFDVTARSRKFLSGLFVYHFRRGKAVRPMLGFGSGGYWRSENIQCEPAGCGAVFGAPREGKRQEGMIDVILIAGLSGPVGKRWVWRGGCLSHRFANDENGTTELFAGAGYRFGPR